MLIGAFCKETAIPGSKCIFEKLIVAHLIKNIPVTYGNTVPLLNVPHSS